VDNPVILNECPVRYLTAENRAWIDIFHQTHQVRVDGLSGYVRFERTALPVAGGLYDQPARDMEALSVLEAVAAAVIDEQTKERRAREKRKPKPRRG